jgi:hypothetical protein
MHLLIFISFDFLLYRFHVYLCMFLSRLQIWIKPQHPNHLAATFSNLEVVHLTGIFPECDLNWTLFILEAASYVSSFTVRLCLSLYFGYNSF